MLIMPLSISSSFVIASSFVLEMQWYFKMKYFLLLSQSFKNYNIVQHVLITGTGRLISSQVIYGFETEEIKLH